MSDITWEVSSTGVTERWAKKTKRVVKNKIITSTLDKQKKLVQAK